MPDRLHPSPILPIGAIQQRSIQSHRAGRAKLAPQHHQSLQPRQRAPCHRPVRQPSQTQTFVILPPYRRQSAIECPLPSPDRAPVHMMTSRAMVPKPRLDFLSAGILGLPGRTIHQTYFPEAQRACGCLQLAGPGRSAVDFFHHEAEWFGILVEPTDRCGYRPPCYGLTDIW